MKMQTIGASTEICLNVPTEEAFRVMDAINGVLRLAGHTVRRENTDGEALYTHAEVFPEARPGMALRGLRVKEGLTQKQLADRLGIRQHRVSEMEKGVRPITVDMARRIGEAYGISYKVFL